MKSNGSRTTITHYTVNDIVLRGIIAINKLLKPQPTVKKIVGKITKQKNDRGSRPKLVEDSIIYQPTPAVGDYYGINLQGFAPEGIFLLDSFFQLPAICVKSFDKLLI